MQPNQPNEPQPPEQSLPGGGSFSRSITPISDISAVQANTLPETPAAMVPVGPAAPAEVQEVPQTSQAEVSEPDDSLVVDENTVSWRANEYIHQERGKLWFVGFGLIIIALGVVSVLNSWWTFLALLVVIAIVVVVYTQRPPHELGYVLSDDGLEVDGKLYEFENFKAFGVIKDGDEYSVMLIPTQRFQPGLTVYFPEESGEDIVDMLGSRLPIRDLKLDVVDRVVRMLRL